MWPSLWGFLEELFPVSSKLTSLITLCACTGDFILPFVVGKYIESYPSVYLYSLLFYNVLAILVFSLCCALASKLCKIKEILFWKLFNYEMKWNDFTWLDLPTKPEQGRPNITIEPVFSATCSSSFSFWYQKCSSHCKIIIYTDTRTHNLSAHFFSFSLKLSPFSSSIRPSLRKPVKAE